MAEKLFELVSVNGNKFVVVMRDLPRDHDRRKMTLAYLNDCDFAVQVREYVLDPGTDIIEALLNYEFAMTTWGGLSDLVAARDD